MKRLPYLLPITLLTAMLIFSLWNGHTMTEKTDMLQQQLHQADQLAAAGNWSAAAGMLAKSYRDWTACQTWFHIVTRHDAIDDAEAMYCRAAAFIKTEEISEFRAETADLISQLGLLAEMEQCSIKNVL